ncbi:glycosyltransferase family 8 [Vibrio maritimus]|uniref:Glycosyltransferase family 8 n=1 Tax=Vibrio maritimus TaxID=990268 RepID=A0A090TE31_9VIBR|nr:glycosyltransferase family 8 [Vibrio maritimus]
MTYIKSIYRWFIRKFNTKVLPSFVKSPKVISREQTVKRIHGSGLSISRFGDGEFRIIYGKSISFQEYDSRLKSRLIEVIKSKNQRHMVCIPDVFSSLDKFNENAKFFWSEYVSYHRYKIYSLLTRRFIYGDSLVTRPYMDRIDKDKSYLHFKNLMSIWRDKDLLIVEGRYSRLGVGNDLFAESKSIKRILCPEQNCFSYYDNILASVLDESRERLVLIALGPTATVLAYDLCLKGVQALDIGHLDVEYEWMKMRAIVKAPIPNKYVNETVATNKIKYPEDSRYREQIVFEVEGNE